MEEDEFDEDELDEEEDTRPFFIGRHSGKPEFWSDWPRVKFPDPENPGNILYGFIQTENWVEAMILVNPQIGQEMLTYAMLDVGTYERM